MRHSRWVLAYVLLLAVGGTASLARAQAPADGAHAPRAGRTADPDEPRVLRPGLFIEEVWKQSPQGGEHPVTADSNSDPDADVKLYVPSGQILLTGRAGDENLPIHLWTGLCASPCAIAFRERQHFADLTGLARIRLNTKMSGFHQVRPIVKLADGTWWVGDRAVGTNRDWLVSEISYADLHWLKLDITRVVTVGNLIDKLDLSKVDELGFADLMPASGHGPGGWADVAQVEVFGLAVPRN